LEALAQVVVQLISGLSVGVLLFLVASGLSLIFGVSLIINFAHGALYMLGAYLSFTLVKAVGHSALGFWLSLLLAPLGVALIGALMEVLFLRRVYRAPHIYQLLLTIALALIVADVVKLTWGVENKSMPRPDFLVAQVSVLGNPLPVYNLLVLAMGALVLLGLWWLFYRTRWGMLVRAATWDRDMLASLGTNTPLLFTTVFAFGAWLAGLGGAMVALYQGLTPAMADTIILMAFVVVVVGGLGSFFGTLAAAVLVAELQAIALLFPATRQWDIVLPFAVMALVLILRPWGLFGQPQH